MEKKDENIIDYNAERELFDMVVECVSNQTEASQGEKKFQVDEQVGLIKQREELNKPTCSSNSSGVDEIEKPDRRNKIKRIIYIEEEESGSDLEASAKDASNKYIPKITIIKKICPKNCVNNDKDLGLPDILNTIEEKIQIPLNESCISPIIFMQKKPQSGSLNEDTLKKLEDHEISTSTNLESQFLAASLTVNSSLVAGCTNLLQISSTVMKKEDSTEYESQHVHDNITDLSTRNLTTNFEACEEKERSIAFKVGVIHYGKLKGQELALVLFQIPIHIFKDWQSIEVSLVENYHSKGLKNWERDLFVSVSHDLFEGNAVLVKDLCRRGDGIKSFHMVNEDNEKELTKEWAIKWCKTFEIGFERDPLDFLQDFEELSLAYPGFISLELYEKNDNGSLFKDDWLGSWDGDRDMPVLEKVSYCSDENVSLSENCVRLSPVSPASLDSYLPVIDKQNPLKTDTCKKSLVFSPKKEVNNNFFKQSSIKKEESGNVNISNSKNTDDVKKLESFRQSVVAYAHENGAKAASLTFQVTEDEVKQWCWSGRYRSDPPKVQLKKKETPASVFSFSSALFLEKSSNNQSLGKDRPSSTLSGETTVDGTIATPDDFVKNQRHCASETLTPLSMGLITTRSQLKSQESKSDLESAFNFSRSTMRTRNSSRKLDQNSSPNQIGSLPSSRNSSPPSRRVCLSPSVYDECASSSSKKDDFYETRQTRQSNKMKLDFEKPSTSTNKQLNEKVLSKPSKMKSLIPRTFGYVPTEYSMLHGISNSVVSSYSLRSKRISKSSDGSRKVVLRKSERQNDLVKSAFSFRQRVVEFARQNGVSAAAMNFKLDIGKVKHWSMQSTVQNICQSRLRMSTRGCNNSSIPGPKMIQGQGDAEKMPVFDNYPACFQKRAILLAESKGKDEAAKQFGIPQSVLSEWLLAKDSVLTLSKVENVADWEVDLFVEIHKARLSGVGMSLEELIEKGNEFIKSKSPKNHPDLGDDWAFDFCERFGVTLKEENEVENETYNDCGILNNVGLQRLSGSLTQVQKQGTSLDEHAITNEKVMKASEESTSTSCQKPTKTKKASNGIVRRNEYSHHRQKYSNSFIEKVSQFAFQSSFDEAARRFKISKGVISYWMSKRQKQDFPALEPAKSTTSPLIINIKHDISKVKTEPKDPESDEANEHATGKLVVTIKKEPTEDDKYSIVVPPKVHSTRSSTQNSTRTNYAKLNSGRDDSPLSRATRKKLSASEASLDEVNDEPILRRKKRLLSLQSNKNFKSRIKANSYYQKQYVHGSKRFYSTDFKNSVLDYADKNGIYAASIRFKICSSMITYWEVSSRITRRKKPGLSYCSSVKNDVLEFVKTGSCYDAAIKYRVSPAVVFKWKSDQKKSEEDSPSSLALQALNQQMLEWYKDSRLKGNSLRKSIIMSKAKTLSSQLNILDFKADDDWYKDWMTTYVEIEDAEKSSELERRKSNRKPMPKVQNPNIIYLPTRKRTIEKPKINTRSSPNKRNSASRNFQSKLPEDSDSYMSMDAHSSSSRLDRKSDSSEDDECVVYNNDSDSSDSPDIKRVWLCQEPENFSSLKKRMTCPLSPNGYSDSNETIQGENYSTDFKLIVASFAQASDIEEAAKKFDLDPELVTVWCEKREELESAVNPYFKKPEPSKTAVGFFLNWFRELNIQSKIMSAHKVLHKVDQIAQKFGGKRNLNSSKWFYKWYDERLEKIRHLPESEIFQMEDHYDKGCRIRYPAAFKLEFLKYVERRNAAEACQAFQVSRHLHSHWRKKKSILEMLCQSGKSECNRVFSHHYVNNESTEASDNDEETSISIEPDVEVYEWYKKYVSSNGGPPKFDVLRRKAVEIHERHDEELGNPSTWYFKFCKSFKISEKFVGDPEMLEFVLKQFDQNVTLSQRDLLNNAIDIIRQKKPNFVGSSGWVHRFIRRYPHLVQEVPSVSEMLPASLETCVTNFRKSMKEIQNEGLFLPLAIGSMDEVPLSFPKTNFGGPIRPAVRDCGDKHASGVVLLSCLSDGRILPPLIILKNDMEQEEIDRGGNRLVIYQKDIQVDSDMIIKWLKDVWLCHVPIPNLLVLDYYYPHTSTAVQQFTSESGVRLVIVPGGCSSKLHPVSAGIRRRFEYLIREQWLKHQAKTYKFTVPSAELILEWVTAAHQQLLTETELAKRSFLVTGITSVDDDNQDDLVGDETHLFANGRPFV